MKRNLFQRLIMPLPDLEEYYRQQRYVRFEQNTSLSWIKMRCLVHRVLLIVLRIRQMFSGLSLVVIDDKRKKAAKPIIYACTHIGWDDIEVAYCALKDPSWLLLGDPNELYKSVDGLMLWMNGVICCDTADKKDRYISKETCIKLLQQGGNLLIFPEGAWNTTENQVVMPLFPGTAEIAIRTGAEIVPIAIEQYGKHYYVNIGEAISPAGFGLPQKQQLTDKLRDALCTLKWEIWEQFPVTSRASLSEDAAKRFLAEIMSQSKSGYTVDDVIRTRFHRKETSPEEAFAHLDQLIPCRENAFLLRYKK